MHPLLQLCSSQSSFAPDNLKSLSMEAEKMPYAQGVESEIDFSPASEEFSQQASAGIDPERGLPPNQPLQKLEVSKNLLVS